MTASEAILCLAALLASLAGSAVVRSFALHTNLLDVPNRRSLHTIPTPRGGGLAIVVSFLGATLILRYAGLLDAEIALALLAGGVIAFVGFVDDRRQLSAGSRLGVHVVVAIFAVIVLGGLPFEVVSGPAILIPTVGAMVAILVYSWATNLFNFMDGLDGLAATEAIFVSAAGAVLNYLAGGPQGLTTIMVCLSAAVTGFLFWNWPPAKLFMGDVGSGFLGFVLTVLSFASSHRTVVPFDSWLILGGVFVVDATTTLARRLLRGDRWFEAHDMHAYQHLARRWQQHRRVTVAVMVVNLFWLFPWAFVALSNPLMAHWYLLAAIAPLIVVALVCGAGTRETNTVL